MSFTKLLRFLIIIMSITVILLMQQCSQKKQFTAVDNTNEPAQENKFYWQAPDTSRIVAGTKGNLIRYGRELIAHTSFYLGPKGKVAAVSNGMNCQNCHLDAGTKLWGNNYSAVLSTYPKFRERSGTMENIYKRVNDCIERSLNGKSLDTNSLEMQAIQAYIQWVGQNVPKDIKPVGSGITNIAYLSREADPVQGHITYIRLCQRCHGVNGDGQLNDTKTMYVYPPLWGQHSYNTGAGLYRLSRFAGYVKDNMPFGSSHNKQQLTDEEAWDIAAFVNSQPRPQKNFIKDWPDIAGKPIDHPFGPYTDSFSETQHKYGPFKPIQEVKEKMKSKKGKS